MHNLYSENTNKTNGYGNDNLHHGPGPDLMGSSSINGNDVYNQQDESLGNIKEIMLDMHTGRVSYAVLSFGGFLGMGDKLFAVPWSALKLDTVNKRFIRHGAVKIGAGQLTSIPGLYAAGDVVCSLKQISIAVAEGTLAATAIHHALPANFR